MHVFLSAGEPSGDQHAARLIEELRRAQPTLRVSGMGGPEMEQAGCQLIYPLTNLAVMGIFAVLPRLLDFYRVYLQARQYLQRHRPDVVVLLDFPGFHWWIAAAAKRLGIPVVYYLPPQLWAWGSWRVSKVRRYVDLVLSALPFEAEWYGRKNIPVLYVGHPFFDDVATRTLEQSFLREWTPAAGLTVALLPGSRGHEVTTHFPLLLEVARRLTERQLPVQFLVANYKESQRQWCQHEYRMSGLRLPLSFFVGRTAEIIELADCAAMVSGSVSLELLARRTPATVVYRTGWLTYAIGRCLVNCKYFSLPNLIADREVMPEHFSVGNPEPVIAAMTADLEGWLQSPARLQQAQSELDSIRRGVFSTGASRRAAQAILHLAESRADRSSAAHHDDSSSARAA
jgi:lipid-A-disaccharide synthase